MVYVTEFFSTSECVIFVSGAELYHKIKCVTCATVSVS